MEENAHFAARERIVDLDVSYKNSSFPTHFFDIHINRLILFDGYRPRLWRATLYPTSIARQTLMPSLLNGEKQSSLI